QVVSAWQTPAAATVQVDIVFLLASASRHMPQGVDCISVLGLAHSAVHWVLQGPVAPQPQDMTSSTSNFWAAVMLLLMQFMVQWPASPPSAALELVELVEWLEVVVEPPMWLVVVEARVPVALVELELQAMPRAGVAKAARRRILVDRRAMGATP